MKKAKPAGVTISFTTEELAELAAVMNNLVVDWHKEHAGALDQARFKILNAADTLNQIKSVATFAVPELTADDATT